MEMVNFIKIKILTSPLAWNDKKLVTLDQMLTQIKLKYELIKVPDRVNDTAKGYKVPGYLGKVGFISSMSSHFCGSCNRLRITADGNLKACLFSNDEVSLRDMLRNNASDDEIYQVINSAVKGKKFSHDGMYNISESKNRPMIKIGG